MQEKKENGDIVISGTILSGERLDQVEGSVIIREGRILAIEEERSRTGLWIIPAFFNAHTHIADTLAMDYPVEGDLKSLVTPPNGVKHRLLAEAPRALLEDAIVAGIRAMVRRGTAGFADFREGGAEGVTVLREAVSHTSCQAVIFGREGGEMIADGLGVSSVRDAPDTVDQVSAARKAGKMIAFHAGEADPDDIDAAIALDPDLLVHCTHATDHQLQECADKQIPIVICTRSNWRLGVTSDVEHPPVREMIRLGCSIYLGTDNAMFVSPDIFREMAFISAVYRLDPRTILRAAIAGSALGGRPYWIQPRNQAHLLVLDPSASDMRFSHDIPATLVNRATECSIVKKVFSPREINV